MFVVGADEFRRYPLLNLAPLKWLCSPSSVQGLWPHERFVPVVWSIGRRTLITQVSVTGEVLRQRVTHHLETRTAFVTHNLDGPARLHSIRRRSYQWRPLPCRVTSGSLRQSAEIPCLAGAGNLLQAFTASRRFTPAYDPTMGDPRKIACKFPCGQGMQFFPPPPVKPGKAAV